MKMRAFLIALPILLCAAPATHAEVSVSIGFPGVNIGINVPVYPRLVLVPGYPVYYDPRANSNYFFYDGMYWVYQEDNWYASSWYNGPWQLTEPEYVPLFVLRVPVRYYRQPPVYFRGWRADAPPRWGAHWGRDWEQRRRGWDRWDRRATPSAAPLPAYQRQFSGARYPSAVQRQESIRSENYRYRPREAVTRQHWEQRRKQGNVHTERQAQPPVQQRSQTEPQNQWRSEQRQPMPAQPAARPQPAVQYQPHPSPREFAPRAAPQDHGRPDKANSHDREREDKDDQRGNGKGNKHEERGQDRR